MKNAGMKTCATHIPQLQMLYHKSPYWYYKRYYKNKSLTAVQ